MSKCLKTCKDFIVRQKSITLVKRVDPVRGSFPPEEKFGLVPCADRSSLAPDP